MAVVLIFISSFVSYYLLNNVLMQVAVQDQSSGLQIIKILLSISVVAIATNIFFIKQNCFLNGQIRKHQIIEQDLCQQRDFDMLSGLRNRNSFVRFAQEIEKRGDSISVIVCDIDGLKIINDTLGHMAGDKIIRKAAEILKVVYSSDAHIFRIGGDEYTIIIPRVLAEKELMKFRQSVKEMIASYNANCPSIPLSLSIGFATTSANCSEFCEVMKRADYNMYQEKRACQDKVYCNLKDAFVE